MSIFFKYLHSLSRWPTEIGTVFDKFKECLTLTLFGKFSSLYLFILMTWHKVKNYIFKISFEAFLLYILHTDVIVAEGCICRRERTASKHTILSCVSVDYPLEVKGDGASASIFRTKMEWEPEYPERASSNTCRLYRGAAILIYKLLHTYSGNFFALKGLFRWNYELLVNSRTLVPEPGQFILPQVRATCPRAPLPTTWISKSQKKPSYEQIIHVK